MPVTVITSADAGAPVLSGTIGSLIPVLDFALVTGLGWTKAYSGTNEAAYKASAVEASGAYLRIDDSINAKYAAVRGYETMSAVDTGSNPFPTPAQVVAPGLFIYKSTTADSVARPWQLIGDGALFYLMVEWTGVGAAEVNVFGDIASFKVGDGWPALLVANTSPSATTTNSATQSFNRVDGPCLGHYLARNYAQFPGAIPALKYGHRLTSIMGVGNSVLPYPAPVDNGLYLTPVEIWESATIRGTLPGVYAPVNAIPGTHGDLITDFPALPGRTLKIININNNTGSSYGRVLIDITGPWR